ncbi:carboxylesterase/lipase family protein [Streptomyces sp. cg40]|uniref:carboxylesterase/lipase family protein n=1 Tax=Streptomyces sp. cg40 TaxID=3419764 RepID=UPI003D05E14E
MRSVVKRFRTLAVAVGACLLVTMTVGMGSAARTSAGGSGSPSPSLTVRVAQGQLRGTLDSGARAFRQIPYAAAPTGTLRFAAPQAPAAWKGVRGAEKEGPACIQFIGGAGGISDGRATSEDCLNLDVYTPANARSGQQLPVTVWLHGGGAQEGSGTEFGGQRYADRTGSIFVSINYRLGALGYLALPELTKEDPENGSGNYGLLDQIAALKWVTHNISAFGGNARNITVAGQSAGSVAVCNLLASPFAKGLFQRAVLQSSPCNQVQPMSLSDAYAAGEKFAAADGCDATADVLSCLREITPGAKTTAWTGSLVTAGQQALVRSDVYGTPVLPVAPVQAISSGNWNKVPVLIGNVRSENRALNLANLNMTASGYRTTIESSFGLNAAAVLSHYPLSSYKSPFYAYSALLTDSGKACLSYQLASELGSQVPTWEYEFDDPTSPTLRGLQPPGVDMSNGHSAELAYLWNFTLATRPLTSTERALGDKMDTYWAEFAASASPNTQGQPRWQAVTNARHPVTKLSPTGITVSTTDFPAVHQCGFWASLQA